MTRIAVIEEGYVQDSQIFTADPETLGEKDDWGDYFTDVKHPCQYVGIFTGDSEDEIRAKAAAHEEVHPGIISLVEVELKSDAPKRSIGRVIVGRPINGISINGLEFILNEDGDIKEFSTLAAAKAFLLKNGIPRNEFEDLTFMDSGTHEIIVDCDDADAETDGKDDRDD